MRPNKKPGIKPGRKIKPFSIINPHRWGYNLQKTHHGFALTKTVRRDLHFYRRLKGWAVSVEILEWALEQGIDCIVYYVKGEDELILPAKTSEQFLSNLDYWIEHKGYETQVVIPEKFWESKLTAKPQLELF